MLPSLKIPQPFALDSRIRERRRNERTGHPSADNDCVAFSIPF